MHGSLNVKQLTSISSINSLHLKYSQRSKWWLHKI